MRENQKGSEQSGSFGVQHDRALSALQAGAFSEAERLGRLALQLRVGDVGAANIVGQALLAQRKPSDAIPFFQMAIQKSPDQPNLHFNLCLAYQALGRIDFAIASAQQAITLDPKVAVLHSKLGQLMLQANAANDAIPILRHALTLDPKSIPIRINLAQALTDTNDLTEAESVVRATLFLAPNEPTAHRMLGRIYQIRGEFDKAVPCFEKSIQIQPNQAAAYFALSYSRKAEPKDQVIVDAMQGLLRLPAIPESDRMLLDYAIGKSLDDLEQQDQASHYFQKANDLALKSLAASDRSYQPQVEHQKIDQIIEQFDEDFIRSSLTGSSNSTRPIFVVGMIRSGTTLVEQTLAKHSEVAAGGELRFWLEHGPQFIAGLSSDTNDWDVSELVSNYQTELDRISASSDFVTDKMPLNFMALGLIHLAFPKAKIIHVRRNPLDTCLSIFVTPYRTSPSFGHQIQNIADAYIQYQRLMDHWRSVIPAENLYEVDYEALVTEPEATSRAMAQFCGLRSRSGSQAEGQSVPVTTPSLWQVRQPFYKHSIRRWELYRSLLEPILAQFPDTQ